MIRYDVRNYADEDGEQRITLICDLPITDFPDMLADMTTPVWQQNMLDSYKAAMVALDLGITQTERRFGVPRE